MLWSLRYASGRRLSINPNALGSRLRPLEPPRYGQREGGMSPSSLSTRRWWRRRVPSIALALLAAVFLSRGAQAMIGDKGVRDTETERAGVECDPEAWRSREKEPTLFLMLTSVLRPSTLDLDLDPQKKNQDYVDSPFTGQGVPPPGVETTLFMVSTGKERKYKKEGKKEKGGGPKNSPHPSLSKKPELKKLSRPTSTDSSPSTKRTTSSPSRCTFT